jgi:hypothetical protein
MYGIVSMTQNCILVAINLLLYLSFILDYIHLLILLFLISALPPTHNISPICTSTSPIPTHPSRFHSTYIQFSSQQHYSNQFCVPKIRTIGYFNNKHYACINISTLSHFLPSSFHSHLTHLLLPHHNSH